MRPAGNGGEELTLLAVTILERAGETLGEYLPRFGGALALLVVGLLLTRFAARILVRVLLAGGLDALADRLRVHEALGRAGLERSLSRLTGLAFRLGISVAIVFASISLVGIQALDEALNEGILFLPRLLAALLLALVGIVLGGFARERVERVAYQMDLRGPLGPTVQIVVVGVAGVVALGQLGVPTDILTVLAGIVAAGAVLTLTLAFGLGSRDLAREISAGRYVSTAFEIGQRITIGEDRGEIVAIESASTVLKIADSETVRVPNHLFLEARVRVHDS